MIKKRIKEWLDIHDLENRINKIENQINYQLRHFGNYKNRTKGELELMRKQIDDLLQAVEYLIKNEENKQYIQSAKNLRKRLRNNRTRIEKAA